MTFARRDLAGPIGAAPVSARAKAVMPAASPPCSRLHKVS